MTCIDQLRRIRETASGHCAEILDRAIAALEDEQGTDGTRTPESTGRLREERTAPTDDANNWEE